MSAPIVGPDGSVFAYTDPSDPGWAEFGEDPAAAVSVGTTEPRQEDNGE